MKISNADDKPGRGKPEKHESLLEETAVTENLAADDLARKRADRSALNQFLAVVIASAVGTFVMVHLNAFEKLHRFTRPNEQIQLDEFITFLPTFLAMGFVLYAYQRVLELREEITRRRAVEMALQKSEQRYKELSITDELTGLFNSRYFFAKMEEEIRRASRFKHPLSLIFLDIDNFKKFNDTYGHPEGDKVLAVTGKVIQYCIREIDSAYRYGGEEFTVILPGAGIEDAMKVAERIRKDVSAQTFSPKAGETLNVTVSIGVARHEPEEPAEDLVKRADYAMYVAKSQGKNQVSPAALPA